MKKYLSLLLAVAMVLMTMAIPVAAAENITISFDAAETVKPGDTFTVAVNATGDVTYNAASVYVDYDETAFDYVGTDSNITEVTIGGSTNKLLAWVVEGEDTLTAEASKLFDLEFDVLADAVPAAYEFSLVTTSELSQFGDAEGGFYDATAAIKSVTVASNTFEATLDGEAIVNGTTYVNSNGVALAVTGTNVEYIKINDKEVVVEDNAYTQVLTADNYTVEIKVVGQEAVTYTFIVSTTVTEATLAIAADKAEYKAGETINVTATIDGLGENTADMVSFDLTYDPAKVTPVAQKGLTFADGKATFVYGDNGETAVANGAVATIAFTTNADITYGNTAVALVDESIKISLTGDWSGNDASCTVTKGTATVVVVPAEGIAWATIDTTVKTGWADGKDDAYNVDVESVAGATVKYVAAKNADTADLAALYATATDLTDGAIVVNAEANYYVIAKIGTEPVAYALVDTLENGKDVFYDVTAPVITNTIDVSAWASTLEKVYEIAVSDANFTATDSFAVTTTYAVGNGEAAALTDKIVVPAGTANATVVTITATDLAGNAATSNLTLKVDPDAPVLNVEAADQANGAIVLTVEATDATSNVTTAATFTKVDAEPVAAEIVDGKITAKESGTYTVVATDEAGNKTTVEKVVEILGAATVPAVSFKTVNNEAAVAGTFKTDAELAEKTLTTNGTFTYVSYTIGADTGANVTKAVLTKGGNTVNAIEGAGKYVLTLTTVNGADASTSKTVAYTFDLVDDQNNMLSPSNDANYTIRDYSLIKNAINGVTDGLENVAGPKFATYLAGDLDGNFQMTSNDFAEIIAALKNGEITGYYDFAIMNVPAAE